MKGKQKNEKGSINNLFSGYVDCNHGKRNRSGDRVPIL